MLDVNKKLDQWGPIEAKLLYMSFWFESTVSGSFKRWGVKWPNIVGIIENLYVTYIWEKESMLAGGFGVIENILLNPNVKQKLWRHYEFVNQKLKELERNFDQALIIGDDILVKKLAVDLTILLKETWDTGVTPELANFSAPYYLEEKLKPYVDINDMPACLEVLLSPDKLSFHKQSEKDLLELVTNYGDEVPEGVWKEYCKKWFWIENSYFESKILDKNYFKKQIFGLDKEQAQFKIKEIDDFLENIRKRKDLMVKDKRLPADIKFLAGELSFSIWWQDHRKGLAWWADSLVDKFSNFATKKFGISLDDLMMYRCEEWSSLFSKGQKVSPAILEKRKRISVFKLSIDKIEEFFDKEAVLLKERYTPSRKVDRNDEIKGISVSVGKVVGKVRKLMSSRESDKLKEGEILVTSMTSPDFIVAMKKSLAVVTDVGGLMSHAAIVSRELKIPCIVGTKIATKVLKDGDFVEVNANHGMVKIIRNLS